VKSRDFVREAANPTPDFLDILRSQRWSSLGELDPSEYRHGLETIEQQWSAWARAQVTWPEERTLVFGRVPNHVALNEMI